MIPVAFAAEAGNRIVQLDTGYQDAGEAVPILLESAAVAPGGITGDCAFDRVRLTLTWSAAATLTVTPILDGVALAASAHTLTLAASAARQSEVFELVFRRAATSGSTYALRGTWLAVRIEGERSTAGDLIVDPAVLEYEVLSPTQEQP